MTKPRNFLLASLAAFAVAGLLSYFADRGTLSVPPVTVAAFRWLALAIFIGYAALRRSLTTWIVVGMLVGGAIGHDFPRTADSLQVLSKIFLQLIKTIVAPLIFSTLVVGIAGHSNLRQVGRMGVKALVYFEVITTIALVIGLAAINISKAGVGVNIVAAAPSSQTLTAPPKQ